MCVSKINIRRLSIALTIFVLFMLICVDVFAADYPDKLIPGGRTTGIKLYADGAVVTGFSSEKSPARSAGLKIGDVIVSVDGQDITDKNTLTSALSRGNDKDFELEIIRKGQEMKVNVVADFDAAKGAYSIGASVKDSIAGIGT
ncbi:MAG: PDZ domain-containing protein, partial [Clostridia bacterium]|nr:PDZ domain-containing protein [Clostridia bacterium]